MSKTKLAFFDFDDTIIKGDSIIHLLLFAKNRKYIGVFHLLKSSYYGILWKLKLCSAKKSKEKALSFLKDKNIEDLNILAMDFNNTLKNYIYSDAIDEINNLKKQGYLIIIISASTSFYLDAFNSILMADSIIGTNIDIINNHFSGKIKGENCKGVEKINRINDFLQSRKIVIDYDNSKAYSDSLSDLPMLSLVKNKYLVNASYKIIKRLENKKDFDFLRWN